MKKITNLYIFAVAAHGSGLSGSDRIFIELAKIWGDLFKIHVVVWEEGYDMCIRNNLNNANYVIWKVGKFRNLGFLFTYFYRILLSTYKSITLKIPNSPETYIYAASDFWQDLLPCIILKIRYPKIKFIGSYYLNLPNPFFGYYEKSRKLKFPNLNNLLLYTLQRPVKFLLNKYADYIFVTSSPDTKWFNNKKCVVIMGGVDVVPAKQYYNKQTFVEKEYLACFLGRFHEQKGVIDLVYIWKKVIDQLPDAKLVMMGDGPAMQEVKAAIKNNSLTKNIILTGYVFDGDYKYSVFKKSRMILHPAKYDSGGMAAAEGMAWGLPGISYDLEALKTYYSKGMYKVKEIGDVAAFTNAILLLNRDVEKYNKLATDAREYVWSVWSWDARAKLILNALL